MYVTHVTRRGQTTIPIELREALGITPEDEVVWMAEGEKLIVEPRKKVRNALKELEKIRFRASKTAEELCQSVEEDFW